MSRIRAFADWLDGCHRLWAVSFAAAFVEGTRDQLFHGWSPGRLLFQVSVICCGAAALGHAKQYLFDGVAFRVENGDPGDDDGGDDDGEGQEISAPLMPATKEEVRAAGCACPVWGSECPVCQRRARLGVN